MKFLDTIKKFVTNNKIALICGVGLFALVAFYPVDYSKEAAVFESKIEEVQKEIDDINKKYDENELKDLVEEIEKVKLETESLNN